MKCGVLVHFKPCQLDLAQVRSYDAALCHSPDGQIALHNITQRCVWAHCPVGKHMYKPQQNKSTLKVSLFPWFDFLQKSSTKHGAFQDVLYAFSGRLVSITHWNIKKASGHGNVFTNACEHPVLMKKWGKQNRTHILSAALRPRGWKLG